MALRRFGLHMGIGLTNILFLSETGYGFRGNYGNVWTYLSFQFQINKNKMAIWEFQMDFKKSFCWHFDPNNNDIIYFLVDRSENEWGKWHFLVWNKFRIWRTGQHKVSGKAFKRILGLDFSIHCVIVFFPFLWPPWLKHTNHHLSSSLLLHKLEDVKLSLPIKTDDITVSKTRDVDPQRCLVTGSSGANGLKMKGFRWNSWDCNTTWYPLFNALLLFTVGLSIIPLRFDCMTISLC